MSLSSTSGRLAAVVLTTVLALAGSLLAAVPAQAANRVTPGNFTGFGFDQCLAPDQEAMDTWLTTSRFWAVGIYIAGINRYCDEQPNLDATWVTTQLRNGWRLLPITVGRQASCSDNPRYKGKKISGRPANGYAAARGQGRIAANTTVRRAKKLGISPRSTLWYDLEHYTGGARCRDSGLSFLSAWTNRLHKLGYRSGVYSSGSSGIRDLDDARTFTPGKYAMPDQLWIADWNGKANVASAYVRPQNWMPHARVHQYRGDHDERHGGVTINIDSNYLDVGRGSVAPREIRHCGGVKYNYPRYRRLERGDNKAQVKTAQCILRKKGLRSGPLRFHFSGRTQRAVKSFQTSRRLPVTGKMNLRTWTVLLAEGKTPVLKIGSASRHVRRAQRALNAATGVGLPVTGLFDRATTKAVRAYQKNRHLPRTGVIADNTWAPLQRGRR